MASVFLKARKKVTANSKALANFIIEVIMTVISFMIQTTGANVIRPQVTNYRNMLECLSLASLSSLV
jgi:hypothetical protein